MKICRHYVISGRVQGVWFRASTKEQAESHGVMGWVRNCDNGSVEAVVCGEESQVHAMEQWLHQGPRAAKVISIAIEEHPLENFSDFSIR